MTKITALPAFVSIAGEDLFAGVDDPVGTPVTRQGTVTQLATALNDLLSLNANKITSGTFADALIAASNVTQHEAALSITENQISDLQAYYKTAAELITALASADGLLTAEAYNVDGTDLDNLAGTTGFWYGDTLTNSPSGSGLYYGLTIHSDLSANDCIQFAWTGANDDSGLIYFRKYVSAAWRNWQAVGSRNATQAEGEAGTNNSYQMTPLRTAQAIAAQAVLLTGAVMSGNLDFNGAGNIIVDADGDTYWEHTTGDDILELYLGGASFLYYSADYSLHTAAANWFGSDAKAANVKVVLNTAAGWNRYCTIATAGVTRWQIGGNSAAESGSDAGTTFAINAYDDAGTYIDSPILISRAAGGHIDLARDVDMNANNFNMGGGTFTFDADGDTYTYSPSDDVVYNYASGALVWEWGTSYFIHRTQFKQLEQADDVSDSAGYGQWWTRNDTPNTPMFTDDGGQKHALRQDVVSLTPSSSQNNYATGADPYSERTILNIAPTAAITITGISTTNWRTGKEVVIRNTLSRTSASNYMLLLERDSASSSAANQFQDGRRIGPPLAILPGDEMVFRFDGTDLKWVRGSRGRTMQSFFDTVARETYIWGTASGGTGAGGSSSVEVDASSGYVLPVRTLKTGSTASGFGIFSKHYGREFAAGEQGYKFWHGFMSVEDLSTVSEEFVFYAGFSSHYLDSFAYADAVAPTENITIRYDRLTSTSWQSVTSDNGTETANNLITVTADEMVGFMIFVNGDGTRVDFYYSNDMGATWTLGTSHTTNIPTNTSRRVTLASCIAKSAGTTQRVGLEGLMGECGLDH